MASESRRGELPALVTNVSLTQSRTSCESDSPRERVGSSR
jgi:hypothetical protein